MMSNQCTKQKWHSFIFVAIVFFYCNTAYAQTQHYECALKSHSLSHDLDLIVSNDDLISFDYLAVSFFSNEPPYPSCGIRATTEGKKASRTTWNKTTSGYFVKFHETPDEADAVTIKKNMDGYTFYFGGMSPMNCAQSSGIAEEITLKFNSKKCKVTKIRN